MIDYKLAAIGLTAGYGIFRSAEWVISTAIKLAFLIAFIALGVLAMSNSVGLL